ncbi:MAG: hypothetical protein EOO47_13000 [Flavobacterium sp.]|nr:MAG: hypothetical protein EOO47_13000 [Flavobacterium sp.]
MANDIKIETLHLFAALDEMLIELLSSLTDEEWQTPTVAKLWKVKDIASHLLDGNLRGLSISRDKFFGENPGEIHSHQELVSFLNNLNLSWTSATKRLSPKVLIELLKLTGEEYSNHLKTLNPFDKAIFSVAWAGQETSPNWFHIAREYTEKFLHQQQIRDAVGKPGIMIPDLYQPFLNTFMYAFPHTFKDVFADEGTIVSIKVSSEIGGTWRIIKTAKNWVFTDDRSKTPNAEVIIDPDTAWKLFSKSWCTAKVIDKVEIKGDEKLASQALKMVSVMA